MMRFYPYTLLLILLLISGCMSSLSRLEQVGKTPELAKVATPMQKPDYKPVLWPPETTRKKTINSLWQPGARAFFRDQRARRVGDILKITVNINDTAAFANKTNRSRGESDSLKAPTVFGLEKKAASLVPGLSPATLLDVSGANNSTGNGTITRTEAIQTQISAMVTQILPNGNLVVRGSQEVRVNYELREVTIDGIVRPEDISSENGISSDQVAEARISYGGRGQIMDVQQPRIGDQILDAVAPF